MKLREMMEQKKQWRAHVKRVKSLPQDYQIVYAEIQKYVFRLGTIEFESTTTLLSGIVDLFAEGAAAGKPVLEVTGRDVAALCDSLIDGFRTYDDIAQEESDRAVTRAMQKQAERMMRRK
jgi:DNA-binding ferritin-like protein (Dps family)